jgi:hypothetical protein
LAFVPFWDSQRALFLEENGMSKTPPDLTDLPVQEQAYVAAQAAELADLKQEFLGLSLSHGSAQKRLKDEMEAALAAERAAQARAIQNKDTMIADLRLQLHAETTFQKTLTPPPAVLKHWLLSPLRKPQTLFPKLLG